LKITDHDKDEKIAISNPAKATPAITGRKIVIKLEIEPYFFADSNDITTTQNQIVTFYG
jgi:hypothetical protein